MLLTSSYFSDQRESFLLNYLEYSKPQINILVKDKAIVSVQEGRFSLHGGCINSKLENKHKALRAKQRGHKNLKENQFLISILYRKTFSRYQRKQYTEHPELLKCKHLQSNRRNVHTKFPSQIAL